MKISPFVAALVVVLGVGALPLWGSSSQEATMTARGSFDVEIRPVAEDSFPDGTGLGRFSLVKQYHGDLEGTGTGEMLTASTPTEASGAYVAMERIDGTLAGRRGSFILQHSGAMTAEEQSLTIAVVPDSGTGELAGIDGTLRVEISDGDHFYHLEYTLPGRPGG